MKSSFPEALGRVLKSEGGYADNPADPGGATMRGITQHVYDAWRRLNGQPPQSVRAISPDDVAAIYRRQYANAVHFDELPVGIDYCIFDAAVNSGPVAAITFAQRAARVHADGHFGMATLAALHASPPAALIVAICDARLSFLKRLRTFGVFGTGWTRRVTAVRSAALAMAAAVPPTPSPFSVPLPSPSHEASMTDTSSAPAFVTSKPWWASQTVWGGLGTIGASLTGAYVAFKAGNTNAAMVALAAAFGGVQAIIGRFRATSAIGHGK